MQAASPAVQCEWWIKVVWVKVSEPQQMEDEVHRRESPAQGKPKGVEKGMSEINSLHGVTA